MSEKIQQLIDSESNIRKNKIIQKGARSSSLFKNKKTQMQVTVRGAAYFFKIEKGVVMSEKSKQFIESDSNVRRNKIIKKRARSSSLFINKKA